jgi:hypothetical protein
MGGEQPVRRITNSIRPDALASLLVVCEVWNVRDSLQPLGGGVEAHELGALMDREHKSDAEGA